MYYYVYRITCTHPDSSAKYYYGYRSCTCHPIDDNYWSSSKYVESAIAEYGIASFSKKILKVFDVRQQAIHLEMKLHEKFNVDINPLFFNKAKQTKFGYNCTGSVVKGKTYEEIYGSEKADELKRMRSNAARGKDHSGTNNPMYGKTQSDEVKQKLSKQRSGQGHPMYGWCWITNGTNNKKINPNTSSIPAGWYRGRVMS